MTENEEKLIAAGQALARAIGHTPDCKKVRNPTPCNCGAGFQQAEALDDWIRLVKELGK